MDNFFCQVSILLSSEHLSISKFFKYYLLIIHLSLVVDTNSDKSIDGYVWIRICNESGFSVFIEILLKLKSFTSDPSRNLGSCCCFIKCYLK